MSLFNGMNIKKDNWTEVFSACLGQMVAIQTNAAEIIVKNQDWHLDFPKGIIAFGKDEYPIQFIGTESTVSNTWLWGWENINKFDDKLIKLAKKTKQKGLKWELEPLTTAEFDLNETLNGHNLSIVSCAVSDEKLCYYRCIHDNGAIFVAFGNIPDEVFRPLEVQRFASVTVQCIQQFYVDHKIFIESFLRWNRTSFEYQGDNIIAHFPVDLIIEFKKAGDFLCISSIHTDEIINKGGKM